MHFVAVCFLRKRTLCWLFLANSSKIGWILDEIWPLNCSRALGTKLVFQIACLKNPETHPISNRFFCSLQKKIYKASSFLGKNCNKISSTIQKFCLCKLLLSYGRKWINSLSSRSSASLSRADLSQYSTELAVLGIIQ